MLEAGTQPTPLQRRCARLVGIFYLLNYVFVIIGQAVPSKIRGSGDFAARAQRLADSEHLYRAALVSTTLGWITVLILALVLYVTLNSVNKPVAQLALLFRLGEAFTGAVCVLLSFARLPMYAAVSAAGPFRSEHLEALIGFTLNASGTGFDVSMAFLGVGSTLFFYLFYQSRFIPRVLSGVGVFGSLVLLVVSLADLVYPEYEALFQLGWGPIAVAEIGTALWLLIRGIRSPFA